MAIDRLQDRLATAKQAQVLLQDIDVVGARVERGKASLVALLAFKRVVIVRAKDRAVLFAENLRDSGRQGRLSRRRITHNAEDDRMINSLGHVPSQAFPTVAS